MTDSQGLDFSNVAIFFNIMIFLCICRWTALLLTSLCKHFTCKNIRYEFEKKKKNLSKTDENELAHNCTDW